MNPDGSVTAGSSWLGIRVTLTNPTSSPISLGAKDFQLEDSYSNLYQEFGFTNGSTFPDGWGSSSLQDQTLTPNQTVVGDILFPLPNQNITSFTLLNGTKSYPVSTN